MSISKMKPLYIELVRTGVANRFSYKDIDIIEMHQDLVSKPELFHKILQHELGHDASGKTTWKDFVHDCKSTTPGMYDFMKTRPSTWTQLMPIYYDKRKRQLVWDPFTIFSVVLTAAITAAMYYSLVLIPSLG